MYCNVEIYVYLGSCLKIYVPTKYGLTIKKLNTCLVC